MKFLTALNRKNADLYNTNPVTWKMALMASTFVLGGMIGKAAEHLAKNPR